ncbi:hypothetical protein PQR34_44350 [Paraburkholderia sediminicola]|uniref:hypothetical protein n=1 Tax=Paraburkholderia sediminicola TaxID=458836 RepID=UPI0038BB790A
MLSFREIATLMLVKDAPDQVDPDRAELDALLERRLVLLERMASGQSRLYLTSDGDSVLAAIARGH